MWCHVTCLGISNARKMKNIRGLAIVVIIWNTMQWHIFAEHYSPRVRVNRFVLPTHSNFLKSQYGRMQYVWCEKNSSICYDREKNPLGGTTCCWNKYCKDTTYDNSHCGSCGFTCGYGLTCCGGRCVDLNNNKNHCGSCDKQCPSDEKCSFGLCDYSGGYNSSHH